jgi:dimethylglycine dehydrogenase
VLHDGKLVGRVTNGGYGWRVAKSLALAMVPPELAAVGQSLDVTILGKPHRATVIAESPFDPKNERLRG